MRLLLENNKGIEREDARGRIMTEDDPQSFVEEVTTKTTDGTVALSTEVVQSIPAPDPIQLPVVNTVQKV